MGQQPQQQKLHKDEGSSIVIQEDWWLESSSNLRRVSVPKTRTDAPSAYAGAAKFPEAPSSKELCAGTHPALTLWKRRSQNHRPSSDLCAGMPRLSSKDEKRSLSETAAWKNRAHQESSQIKNLRRINAIEKILESVRDQIHTVRCDAVTETHNNQLTRQRK
jgi:hypothetical protein